MTHAKNSPNRFPCTCVRGWFVDRPGIDWPYRCPKCLGARELSPARLASVLGEDRNVIYRAIRRGGFTAETATRIFPKLARHFPEAFA